MVTTEVCDSLDALAIARLNKQNLKPYAWLLRQSSSLEEELRDST